METITDICPGLELPIADLFHHKVPLECHLNAPQPASPNRIIFCCLIIPILFHLLFPVVSGAFQIFLRGLPTAFEALPAAFAALPAYI